MGVLGVVEYGWSVGRPSPPSQLNPAPTTHPSSPFHPQRNPQPTRVVDGGADRLVRLLRRGRRRILAAAPQGVGPHVARAEELRRLFKVGGCACVCVV